MKPVECDMDGGRITYMELGYSGFLRLFPLDEEMQTFIVDPDIFADFCNKVYGAYRLSREWAADPRQIPPKSFATTSKDDQGQVFSSSECTECLEG